MPKTKSSAPKVRGPRSYVSEFVMTIGPITSIGRLVPVRKTSDDSNFIGVCPVCTEPTKPSQRYICPNDSAHVYPMAELARAKEIDGTLSFVDRNEIEAARESDLPSNVLRLTAHQKDAVWDKVWDGGNSYLYQPRVSDEWYALLVRLVKESDKTFIGMCNLRNYEGLFRLDVWQGHIIVQKILFPTECNEFERDTAECDNDMYETALAMITRIEQEFDPASYRSGVKERLAALSATDGVPQAVTPAAASTAVKENLLAALEAFAS